MSTAEMDELATLIYYPEEKLALLKEAHGSLNQVWYTTTLLHLVQVCRKATSKYTRSKVRKALPHDFSYVIEELITEKEEIQDKEVRLINADGSMVGIVSSAEALRLAEEQELDLVKISPVAVPPVCKIMDYGKFRFDQLKKEKEAKKNQRVVEIKEIRMSPSIDTNDLNTKMRSAMKFLADGNRVKVTVRFRGREMAHTDIGEQLLLRFADGCSENANLDKKPKLDGRHMSIFLSSKAAK